MGWGRREAGRGVGGGCGGGCSPASSSPHPPTSGSDPGVTEAHSGDLAFPRWGGCSPRLSPHLRLLCPPNGPRGGAGAGGMVRTWSPGVEPSQRQRLPGALPSLQLLRGSCSQGDPAEEETEAGRSPPPEPNTSSTKTGTWCHRGPQFTGPSGPRQNGICGSGAAGWGEPACSPTARGTVPSSVPPKPT